MDGKWLQRLLQFFDVIYPIVGEEHLCEVEDNRQELVAFLHPGGSLDLNSGQQDLQQVPLSHLAGPNS